jgi:hypothetical protein
MVMQSEEPNQDIHRRVKRLVANVPRIDTVIYSENEDDKQMSQDIQDALKSLYKWMNRGKIPAERKAVEYQQADGLGLFKLDFMANYADETLADYEPNVLESDDERGENESASQSRARVRYQEVKKTYESKKDFGAEAKAYKDVTDEALRRCDPPFRLSAPDPLTAYWTLDGDQIDVYVEKGKRKVSALLEAYDEQNLRLINNRLVVFPEESDAAGDATIPDNESLSGDHGDECEYTEIRSRKEIVILVRHPKLLKARDAKPKDIEQDYMKLSFDNPFGPYSTGIALIPGDITGSHDPADEFQPSVLGLLSFTQQWNVLMTIRLSAAIDAALASKYVKQPDAEPPSQLDQSKGNKTPAVKDGKPVPVIPGEIKREESPNINLDKAEAYLGALAGLYRFSEVLAGDATSADSGHKLALQVSQADMQIVPYQNSRATATEEILMCCLYAAKNLGQTIFVKEIPDQSYLSKRRPERLQPVRSITPDMFDLDFNLIVSIGSETPLTRYSKWAALEGRYKAGTLSFETLMEESDTENVADEITRIFEGQTLVSVMQQAIPVIVKMIAARAVQKLNPAPTGTPVGEGVVGDEAGIQGTIDEGGNEGGGGMPGAEASTPIAQMGRIPGAGLSPAGPTTAEYGPRVHQGGGDMGGTSE